MTTTMEKSSIDKSSMDKASFAEEPSFDSSSQIQPPPSYSSSISPTLTIRYNDWRARHGKIIDAATGSTLYTSEHRYRSPTFALNKPSGESIATATSSKWTMRFDINVAGRDFELTPRHKLGCDIEFISQAYGGQKLTWKSTKYWNRLEYVLLDENSLAIARFLGGSAWKCMPWGEFGGFEFMEGRVETEEQRDEVVGTGLCLAYKAVVNRNASLNTVVT